MSYEYEHKDLFEGVVGVVEVTNFESLCLWQKHTDCGAKRDVWKQSLSGPLVTVGHIYKRPICISLFVHTIDGHRILFMEPTSQIVDHKKIEAWLLEHLPDSAMQQHWLKEGSRYINKVDAMNFNNVFPRTPVKDNF